jgi:hypothetical protein
MATEILLVNGASGWTAGAATDIDEGHVTPNTPDGNVYSTSSTAGGGKGDIATLDFVDSALADSDTISAVDIYIRARRQTDPDSDMDVQLVIGGTPQGTAQSLGITGTLADYTVLGSAGGWNSDYTATQLDGLQVQVTATQSGMPTDDVWEIDSCEVHITYTGPNYRPVLRFHRHINFAD